MSKKTLGKNLEVGDTIEVWWEPHRDRITDLKPYQGTLEHLWSDEGGARLPEFAMMKTGMTMEPQIGYGLVHRPLEGEL